MSQICDPLVWAQEQFGTCQFGDRRRTKRVVKIAAAMAQNSAAATPTQCAGWPDLKATYRLFDNSKVSFQELITPHRQLARQQCRGTVLVVDETSYDILQRSRESQVWGEVVQAVGSAPSGAHYIHVCDRGADIFEFYCQLVHGEREIEMSAVEVREINAPTGATPLQWVLLSSEPCDTSSQALQIVLDYEKRWVVEDYHKGIKTGCRFESRQYMEATRLERVLGIVAVVAIRLLQLRAAARQKPDEPAQRHIPSPYLVSLCAIMNKSASSQQAKRAAATPETLTNREFYRRVAQLGGFIGRKSDGEPGWQTLWRGFEKLHSIVYGYSLAQTCG